MATMRGVEDGGGDESKFGDDDHVVLNVGGTIFETRASTLSRRPSMLSAMFGECISMAKPDARGHYFFDRDGKHFRVLLNFLRTGRVVMPESRTDLLELQLEAEYFAVDDVREACQRALGGLLLEENFTSFNIDSGKWKEAPMQTLTTLDPTPTRYLGLPEVLRLEEVGGTPALRMSSRLECSTRRGFCTQETFGPETQRCEVQFFVMPRRSNNMGSMSNMDGVLEFYLWNPTSGEYIGMFLNGAEHGERRELVIVCHEGGHKKEKVVDSAWNYEQDVRFTIQAFGDKTEVRIHAVKKKTFHVPVGLNRIAPFHIVLGHRMLPASQRAHNDHSMHYADVAVRRLTVFG